MLRFCFSGGGGLLTSPGLFFTPSRVGSKPKTQQKDEVTKRAAATLVTERERGRAVRCTRGRNGRHFITSSVTRLQHLCAKTPSFPFTSYPRLNFCDNTLLIVPVQIQLQVEVQGRARIITYFIPVYFYVMNRKLFESIAVETNNIRYEICPEKRLKPLQLLQNPPNNYPTKQDFFIEASTRVGYGNGGVSF